MFPLVLAALLLSPVGAFVWMLWRRREWGILWAFGLTALSIVGAALAWGYRDYRSGVRDSPLFVESGLEMHVTMFAVLGGIVVDWVAVIWGAWYWLSRRRGRVPHATRADRRRQLRGRVASAERRVTK